MHDVALLFLSLLHGADAELEAAEVKAQRQRLRRWFPAAQPDQIQRTLDDVMLVYLGSGRDQMVQTAAEDLRQSLSPEQRVGILNDLADLASVDGTLSPGEIAFIQQLAAYWQQERGSDSDAPPSPRQPNAS